MHAIRIGMTALAVLLVAGTGPAPTQAMESHDFAGEYLMEGWNLNTPGPGYRGVCSVEGGGPAYRVSCTNSDTGHKYVGKGLALGKTFSVLIGSELAVACPELPSDEYLVVYERQSNGVLEGTWINAHDATAGVETLVRAP
ncbi:MAG: hypothetical protein Q8N31_19910 [Reyranella sp.]|nr:hypothetical protein [Reyranella sp.]